MRSALPAVFCTESNMEYLWIRCYCAESLFVFLSVIYIPFVPPGKLLEIKPRPRRATFCSLSRHLPKSRGHQAGEPRSQGRCCKEYRHLLTRSTEPQTAVLLYPSVTSDLGRLECGNASKSHQPHCARTRASPTLGSVIGHSTST